MTTKPTHPQSLTAQAIEAIELAASQAYGIRLRHCPPEGDQELAPKPVKLPPPKPTSSTTSSPSKPKPKGEEKVVTYPETFQEVSQAVLGVLKSGAPCKAAAFHEVLHPDKGRAQRLFEKFRDRMIKDQLILARGTSRAMEYSLPAED